MFDMRCFHASLNTMNFKNEDYFEMNQPLTYSVEEAARRIGVGKNAIYALAKAQKIPAIRVGRRYVINAEMFDHRLSFRICQMV